MNFELLRLISTRKLINLAILRMSYFFSRYFDHTWHWGMPYSLSYEPTTTCNLACPECPTGLRQLKRPKGVADIDQFRQTIDELSPYLLNLTLYFQGEPYLSPRLFDMIRYAHSKHIYTRTSTNGHYLTASNIEATLTAGLHELVVSVDGATQTTYAQYRKNGNLETVLQGIRRLEAAKKAQGSRHPEVELQFLVFRTNQHEIPAMQAIAKELGVRLSLKSAQINNLAQSHHLVPTLDRYARYRKNEAGEYVIKSKLDNACWRMWSSAVITWNGKVLPCCFDKDATHTLGDTHQQNFIEIWRNPTYEQFRNHIKQGRSQIDICRNCTEGLRLKNTNS